MYVYVSIYIYITYGIHIRKLYSRSERISGKLYEHAMSMSISCFFRPNMAVEQILHRIWLCSLELVTIGYHLGYQFRAVCRIMQWFGTFCIFPYIGKNHPNWLICFRGFETTNQLVSCGVKCQSVKVGLCRVRTSAHPKLRNRQFLYWMDHMSYPYTNTINIYIYIHTYI